jgi:uncharacterized protein YuzE
MKLTVDEKADALYLKLDDSTVLESEEIAPGLVLDYNKEGEIIGIEILKLSQRSKKINFKNLLFEIAGDG